MRGQLDGDAVDDPEPPRDVAEALEAPNPRHHRRETVIAREPLRSPRWAHASQPRRSPPGARRARPHALCLGNLFRDQLDRYGELEHVADGWRDAVSGLDDDAVVILNGDDPLVAAPGRAPGRTGLVGPGAP